VLSEVVSDRASAAAEPSAVHDRLRWNTGEAAHGSLVTAINSGLATVFRHPLLCPLTLFSAWFNLFEQAMLTLTLLYAVRELNLSPGLIGALLAMGSVGGLIGTFTAERFGRRAGVGRTLVVSIMLAAIGPAAVPLAAGSRTGIVLTLIAGFGVYGLGNGYFQHLRAQPAYRGQPTLTRESLTNPSPTSAELPGG
jgi:MFS family permease